MSEIAGSRRGKSVVTSLVLAFLVTVAAPFAGTPPPVAVPAETAEILNEQPFPENTRVAEAQPAVRRIEAVDGENELDVALEASPEAISRAFLVYELAGVPHWRAAVRSINGLPALGGFGAAASSGTALQIEEINPRWLRSGVNRIVFSPAPTVAPIAPRLIDLRRRDALTPLQSDGGIPYTVRNLRLVYVDGAAERVPHMRLSHPVHGESDPAGTIVRGFVDPPFLASGPAELFVNEAYLPQGIDRVDGAFSVFVPRTGAEGEAWQIELEVVYPDGTRLRRTVKLAAAKQDDAGGDESHMEADASTEKSLDLGDAHLDITPGALAGKTRLTMHGLRHEELPALDAGMTNVTPQRRGFRFGPHGLRFKKAVHLRLPYDASLIPKGMTAEDVRTFFFDESSGRWVPLLRVDAKSAGDAIVSATEHFTDFVNATLAMPDEPSGVNNAPSSLKELAKADPADEVVRIAPPEGGAAGDASLDFPIVVPPGRRGMQPELAIHYDSGGGNDWLGLGWDLTLPSIEISTEFGVPRYSGAERYRIDGEQLAPTTLTGQTLEGDATKIYVRRSEGRFDRIERVGGSPDQYWWQVTDKDGTRFLYGKTQQARLSDPRGPRNTFRWCLERAIDLHGNTVDYFYTEDRGGGGGNGEQWVELYPDRIDYTGLRGSGAFYSVKFHLDDAPQRRDRISSGVQGFKTYRQHRLDSIDVLAGGGIVRRYVLSYALGDFQKSVLASIAVRGEGAAAEFYRHSFDYFHGTAGFDAAQAWSGISSSNDFTASFHAGDGVHGFAGLGPPIGCQPHGGVQLGGGGSDSTQSTVFVDVNGDGLPDRLSSNGDVDLNHYNVMADPAGTQPGSFGWQRFDGATTIGHTSGWNIDFGAGAHLDTGLSASAMASWSWSHANDDRILTDIDGDLRPDLVSANGGFAVRHNTGHSFDAPSAAWGNFGQGLNLTVAGEENDVTTNFHLANPIRQLVLPYDGHVTFSGSVAKKAAGGDGVDAAIYAGVVQVWSHHFAAGDTAPCTPGPSNSCDGGLNFDVTAGNSLYFVASSGRSTDFDALAWVPVVSYDGQDANAREPYGARVFVFDAAEDFALAGYSGASWAAGAAGTVAITGALNKQETSDDVTLTVEKSIGAVTVPIYSRTFAAAEQTSFEAIPSFSVERNDIVYLRLTSRTPIDPKRVQWTPSVSYQGTTSPVLPEQTRTQRAQVVMAVPRLLPANQPTRSWTPSATGAQTVTVTCSFDVLHDSAKGTVYVQGVDRLLKTQAAAANLFFPSFDVQLPTTAGEPLFLTFLTGGETPSCSAGGGTIPVNVRYLADGQPPSVLSGGHHGWYYGEWNGNVPFTPLGLVTPKSKDDKPDFVAAVPRWDGNTALVRPIWTGTGFDLYLAAEGTKPSRKGANATQILDRSSGAAPGGGLSILRKNYTHTVSGSVSAGVGLSFSHGESETQLDLIDMNGDRYPDEVSSGGVRFSTGAGFGAKQSFDGLDTVLRSEDDNISTSIGLGINTTAKGGKGKVLAVLNSLPSFGSTLSLSQVRYELIDVNGDGLPDRVEMEPGGTTATVRLNLGYRFGDPEAWPLPPLAAGSACSDVAELAGPIIAGISSLNTFNTLSFTRSVALQADVAFGPFGGGISTTLSRTLVDLIDINGDGLPDRVAKDAGDDFFRVQINLGDHWAPEEHWSVPAWTTSIGDGYIVGDQLIHCLDALTFSGHVEGDVSAGVPICIPLVPPIPIVGLQLEISAQANFSVSDGMQLSLQDIDGDGYPDHVLKKSSDGNVWVKRNEAGKANLLHTVYRPLGSTITLDYQRRGNTESMPFSQWVLASVTVDDRRGGQYLTQVQYGNDAVYDRNERENYGYAHVRTILPDGSRIDRDYLNRDLYTRHLQTREAIADANANLYRVETSTYDSRAVSGSSESFFPALTAESTLFYEGTASAEKSTGKTYAYDAAGNVTFTADLGDSGNDDDVKAVVTWANDARTNLTRPLAIEVDDGAGHLLRGRRGTFDAAGDLTELERTLAGGRDPSSGAAYSGSKNPKWTFTYDEYGNIRTSTDPSSFVTTIAYDALTHSYAAEVSDSFGYTTHFTTNLDFGLPAGTTDENGNTISRVYDAFGRLDRVVGPYDNDSSPSLRFEYGLASPVSYAVVHHKDVTRSEPIDSAVFIDSLERVIQTKDRGELDGGTGTSSRPGFRVSGRVDFDSKGRIAAQGQPIFDTHNLHELVDVASKNPTTFTYDALDRARTVRFPYGASTLTKVDYAFGTLDGARRFLTTRTDPAGRVTRFYRDVHDNVMAVEQTNSFGGARKTLTTRYAYDALDQLTAVTDAKGNTTRVEHDTLGRTVAVANPDLGRVETRYDLAGNVGAKLTANLAARGQQIRYLYTFNRLDRVDYPQSPDVAYTYGGPGSPFNRANRVATVTDASGVEERSYGKLGELVQTTKSVVALNGNTPKGPYATRYQYDSFDRLLSVVYPDGETLTYGFDAGGQVKTATGLLNGTRFDYLRHAGYDEFGERVRLVFGNGIETRHTFDPASRFLSGLRSIAASRDLQNLHYRYDATGTLTALSNDVPLPAPPLYGGQTAQSFTYDDLTQLVNAKGTFRTEPNAVSAYNLDFVYDELGNVVAKNQLHQSGNTNKLNTEKKTSYTAAYAYAGTHPHAATQIGDRAFRYDDDGNQAGWDSGSSGTRRTLTWDEENRLATVSDNGQTTSFLYDEAGTRTNKAGQHGETIYLNAWFSLRNGAIASKHVFLDGERIATKVSPDPTPPSEKAYFYQADHLGSAQFVTDEAGRVFQHLEYFPSGELWIDERSETQRTPYLFSGKELDEETGLSYFGYRYYDARQSQWISADPVLDEMLQVPEDADLSESAFQLPGLISGYVGNDPLDHVDPDGHVKTKNVPKKGEIRGGLHGDTKKSSVKGKTESHHIPSASAYPGTPYDGTSREQMPAMTMDRSDHLQTGSHGNMAGSPDYRAKEKASMGKRKFAEAQAMGIKNALGVTAKSRLKVQKKAAIEMVEVTAQKKYAGEKKPRITKAQADAMIQMIKKFK